MRQAISASSAQGLGGAASHVCSRVIFSSASAVGGKGLLRVDCGPLEQSRAGIAT